MNTLIEKSRREIMDGYSKASEKHSKRAEKVAIKVIKRLVALFPKIKAVQPKITSLGFGMGEWYFYGTGIGTYGDGSTSKIIDTFTVKRYLIEGGDKFSVKLPINEELEEIAVLCSYLVDYSGSGLNYSTMIDGIDNRGVTFEREVKPKSPFGHEPKSVLLNSSLYKNLKKAGVKCVVITKK